MPCRLCIDLIYRLLFCIDWLAGPVVVVVDAWSFID